MKIERDTKLAMVRKMVSHLPDGQRQKVGNSLMKKSLAELEELQALVPEPTVNEHQDEFSFPAGAGTRNGYTDGNGGFTGGLTDNEATDVLDLETARQGYDPKFQKSGKEAVA